MMEKSTRTLENYIWDINRRMKETWVSGIMEAESLFLLSLLLPMVVKSLFWPTGNQLPIADGDEVSILDSTRNQRPSTEHQ